MDHFHQYPTGPSQFSTSILLFVRDNIVIVTCSNFITSQTVPRFQIKQKNSRLLSEREMSDRYNIVVDAWIREAEEATKVVEDIERRVKSKDVAKLDYMVRGSVESKLLEVGVKLDRLESLLHNPPSKPILTEKDLEYRWKLLSDVRLRTRAVALTFYAPSSTERAAGLASSSAQETSRTTKSHDWDQKQFLKGEEQLLRPLVAESATRNQVEIKQSYVSKTLLVKVCRTICLIVGAALFLFILIIICAII